MGQHGRIRRGARESGDEKMKKAMMSVWAVLALLALGAGCALDGEMTPTGAEQAQAQTLSTGVGLAAGLQSSLSGAQRLNAALGQAGIWVSGEGRITVEPDLAILSLGVETRSETVAEASAMATEAMDAVMVALEATGVEERDIQTRRFYIQPDYDYVTDVTPGGGSRNRQVLAGYRVSNDLTVKVRDMDSVGEVMNGAIGAGGDAIRFNGLRFTVEDTEALTSELREAAVADALAKAQHMAKLADVELGKLVYITDGQSPESGSESFGEARLYAAAALAAPPVSGGEIEVSMSVYVAFAIEY